jgi:putative DNA primase/helicase
METIRDFMGEPPANALSEVEFIRAGKVKPQNVRWLWQGWLPLGMLSLLLGLPGRGKTTLAEQLAADVTRGRLEGSIRGKPSDVLIVSYEDAIAETLVPRLMAAEANLDRVEFVACRDTSRVLDLTRHLPEIERRAAEHRVKMIVVDPLVAGLPRGDVNSHRDQDVRSVLAPLAAVASKQDLAVIATMHFSKSAVSALLGAGGSIGFVGAARSILVFGVDPHDEQGASGPNRVLAHAKSNVGRLQKSRAVTLTEHVIDPFGIGIVTSRVEVGDQCDVSADDLVKDTSEQKVSARVQAQRFLRQLLLDGPHRARECIELAEEADISVKTLYRAKDDLGIDSFQRKTDDGKPEWWWVLPEEEEPPPQPPLAEEEDDE